MTLDVLSVNAWYAGARAFIMVLTEARLTNRRNTVVTGYVPQKEEKKTTKKKTKKKKQKKITKIFLSFII